MSPGRSTHLNKKRNNLAKNRVEITRKTIYCNHHRKHLRTNGEKWCPVNVHLRVPCTICNSVIVEIDDHFRAHLSAASTHFSILPSWFLPSIDGWWCLAQIVCINLCITWRAYVPVKKLKSHVGEITWPGIPVPRFDIRSSRNFSCTRQREKCGRLPSPSCWNYICSISIPFITSSSPSVPRGGFAPSPRILNLFSHATHQFSRHRLHLA